LQVLKFTLDSSLMKNIDIHGGNIAAIAGKLGIESTPEILYDFSVNINPFGMPVAVERAISGMGHSDYSNYPEIYAKFATESIAEAHNLPLTSLLLGNGSTELFMWIIQSIDPTTAHIIAPCYSGYSEICKAAGVPLKIAKFAKAEDEFRVNLEDIDFSDIELLFLATPNNPTGTVIPKNNILSTVNANPETFFVIDESFIDFLPEGSSLISEKELPANIAVVKSLTKFFAIAGIRLGMLSAHPETVAKFAEKRLPWSVNATAQVVAPKLYSNHDYICESRKKICELRKELSANLAKINEIKTFPGSANFILCQLLKSIAGINNVENLQKELLKKGILIRSCSDIPGLDNSFFRIAVETERENKILLNAVKSLRTSQ